MPKLIFSLLLALLLQSASGQKKLVWPILAMTTYDIQEDGINSTYTPNFPKILEEQFEDEVVTIAGYLIPIDVEAQKYALSKNPFSSCFFCGNAGPETVIELRFAEPPGRFVTDQYLMIKGRLKLVRNGQGLFFILQNAEIHG